MPKAALPPLIRQLLRPEPYPHSVNKVELVQTHISFVLLAGEHVYKIKKPVNFGFLDFSTLSKRRFYCQQEVSLNSRLCPANYRGVVRIREGDGRMAIEGPGRVVEYAVHMRRLPAERMMDRLLADGELTLDMVMQLAHRLSEFHQRAETSLCLAKYGDWAIRFAWRENFEQWQPYIGQTLTVEQDRLLRDYGRWFFRRKRELLLRRVQERRIRDCHGDLRSDSVCFADGLCVFDCIEFNKRFRYTDVAGDVSFLAMDLDYRDRPDLAQAFVQHYHKVSGDDDLLKLINFYKCYRAAVRGKVEGLRASQPEVGKREKASARRAAKRYFALACRYARQDRPLLLITCGLTATGKSVLAHRLAEAKGLGLVSSDVLRKELAGLSPRSRRHEPFQKGIYSRRFTDRTYRALLERAQSHLAEGRSVIIDASFVRRQHRLWAQRLAKRWDADFYCLEFQASDAVVRRRLRRRQRMGNDPSDARWEIYAAQKDIFQPADELEPERHFVIDTRQTIERQRKAVLDRLFL